MRSRAPTQILKCTVWPHVPWFTRSTVLRHEVDPRRLDIENILCLEVDREVALVERWLTVKVCDEHHDPFPVVTVPFHHGNADISFAIDPKAYLVPGSDSLKVGNQLCWWLTEEIFHSPYIDTAHADLSSRRGLPITSSSPKREATRMTNATLKPVGYSVATPRALGIHDYDRLCTGGSIHPTDGGWGFQHCVDDDGEHVTLITHDVGCIQGIIQGGNENLTALTTPPNKFTMSRPGWPEEWMAST